MKCTGERMVSFLVCLQVVRPFPVISTVLLMTLHPYSATTQNVAARQANDFHRGPMRFAMFITIAVIGIVLFPVAFVCSVLAFWSSDTVPSLLLIAYVTLHAAFLVGGLTRRGHGRRLFVPVALVAVAIFGYNRHWSAQPDNSPFSNSIGTVGQRAYGAFAWLRRFDQPFSSFGDSHVDWTAVAVNVELVIAFTAILTVASLRWGLLLKPIAEPTDSTERRTLG